MKSFSDDFIPNLLETILKNIKKTNISANDDEIKTILTKFTPMKT